MKSRFGIVVAVAALIIGAAVMVTPSTSEAVNITSVSVTVGGTTWCSTNLACTNPIWNLGAGVNLANAGDSLILTQTGGQNSFNFDTSEGNAPACNAGNPCATTIAVNGVVVGGGNNILANNNVDPGTSTHNEAADYGLYGATAAFRVDTGYADNIHSDACADTIPAGGNCLPGPFAASATDTFIGGGASGVGTGVTQGGANHCSVTVGTDCFDAGVVRIVALDVPRVPEPSSLLLLGVGIMGLAAWGRSRRA